MMGVLLGDVLCVEMFVCYCECILGVNQYGALQHADAMVYGTLTRNRMCRGRKSFGEGCVNERYDGGVLLGDVCRDEMFGCCCECIGGVNMVHCNTLIQWYMVH